VIRRTKNLVKIGQRRRGSLIFGNNLPNFEQGSTFGRILPPLNGEFKFLGEFRGSLVTGASGQRDIGSRGFGSSGGFNRGSNFSSNSGLSGNSKYSLFANLGSSI
jgi:hypothetical protein